MEKTIAASGARRQFVRMLEEVSARGDRFVVERRGEPVAALVPIAVYEHWKRGREEFFDRLQVIAERANLPPDEAEELAREAVRAVRGR